jgi:hypothetical protein
MLKSMLGGREEVGVEELRRLIPAALLPPLLLPPALPPRREGLVILPRSPTLDDDDGARTL